jgi:hypothetical protein
VVTYGGRDGGSLRGRAAAGRGRGVAVEVHWLAADTSSVMGSQVVEQVGSDLDEVVVTVRISRAAARSAGMAVRAYERRIAGVAAEWAVAGMFGGDPVVYDRQVAIRNGICRDLLMVSEACEQAVERP